jgi:hypothetical protein
MDLSKMKHIIAIISVIVLDYAMLHFGYLGEMGKMEKWNACLSGFLPFGLMFAIIYFVFLKPNPSNKKMVFYWFFFVLWSLYGFVYLLDNNTKNIILNCFDAVAKGGIGIGLYTELL